MSYLVSGQIDMHSIFTKHDLYTMFGCLVRAVKDRNEENEEFFIFMKKLINEELDDIEKNKDYPEGMDLTPARNLAAQSYWYCTEDSLNYLIRFIPRGFVFPKSL